MAIGPLLGICLWERAVFQASSCRCGESLRRTLAGFGGALVAGNYNAVSLGRTQLGIYPLHADENVVDRGGSRAVHCPLCVPFLAKLFLSLARAVRAASAVGLVR